MEKSTRKTMVIYSLATTCALLIVFAAGRFATACAEGNWKMGIFSLILFATAATMLKVIPKRMVKWFKDKPKKTSPLDQNSKLKEYDDIKIEHTLPKQEQKGQESKGEPVDPQDEQLEEITKED